MALIACTECGNEISDKAAACPKCGNPIATTGTAQVSPDAVVTIEETGKGYKAGQAAGVVIAFVGLLVLFGGNPGPAIALMFVGVAIYFWARVGAWWNHG